jgi:hypothetical protein
MPLLAAMGNYLSRALDSVIFAFPSHRNGSVAVNTQTPSASELDDMFSMPGDAKALAGGVGPLSFAGSGYGVTLILMVRVPTDGLTIGHTVEPDSPHRSTADQTYPTARKGRGRPALPKGL